MSDNRHTKSSQHASALGDDAPWQITLELPADSADRTTVTRGFESVNTARAALVRVIVDLAADWVPLRLAPDTEQEALDNIDLLSRAAAEIANATEPTEVLAGDYRFIVDRG